MEYDTAATGEAALDAGTSMECEVQDDEEPAEDLSPEKKKAKKDTATGNETPSSFFPKYLYFIMRWGILADEPQEPLCEILTVGDNSDIPVKKATGPSRAELRTSLQVEAKAAASTHKVDKNELGGNSPKGGGATSLTDKELSMRKFVDNQARSMKSNELESLKHMAQEDLDDERAAEPPNAARIAVAQAELDRCKKDLRDFYRKRTDI